MENQNKETLLSVSASEITRDKIIFGINDDKLKANLKLMDVIIIPQEYNTKNYQGKVFASHFDLLYDYLKNKGINVEVATEEEPLELLLHSDLINLGRMFIGSIVLPVITKILSSYIYDYIKKHSKDAKNSTVRCELIVEKYDKSTISIKYDGPVEPFEHVINHALSISKEKEMDSGKK
jgi:hypothetical protein